MKRTNNTRKGGNQVSFDETLTARGICEKNPDRLTAATSVAAEEGTISQVTANADFGQCGTADFWQDPKCIR